MNFEMYQIESRKTAIYLNGVKAKYKNLPKEIETILALSYVSNGLGEVGEIQGKLKKIIRDSAGEISQEQKKEIGKEIGDVLWYLSNMCSELGLSFDDVATQNIEKLQSRQARGVLTGSGDNR